MLKPKNTKFKKHRKGVFKKFQKNAMVLSKFKSNTLKIFSLQFGRISEKQLVSSYFSINKIIKKVAKCVLKIFPFISVTKKPKEIRMGKGKGTFSFWALKVVPGSLIFEIFAIKTKSTALLKFKNFKLPVKLKITK